MDKINLVIFVMLMVVFFGRFWLDLSIDQKIKYLEAQVDRMHQAEAKANEAHKQALWAQNLLVENMDSVGKEIRAINKQLGMPPWGWGER